MRMRPGLRKSVLATHLAVSVGWIGAVLAYLALGVSAVTTRDVLTVRAAWIMMELIGWTVIVPLALASLTTGIVISLGTPWGLFRHYWVLISLVLTILSTIVLVDHMPGVSATASMARMGTDAEHLLAMGGDLLHPAVGLVGLIVITVLNVFKPKGLTRYGWRKQQEERRNEREPTTQTQS